MWSFKNTVSEITTGELICGYCVSASLFGHWAPSLSPRTGSGMDSCMMLLVSCSDALSLAAAPIPARCVRNTGCRAHSHSLLRHLPSAEGEPLCQGVSGTGWGNSQPVTGSWGRQKAANAKAGRNVLQFMLQSWAVQEGSK